MQVTINCVCGTAVTVDETYADGHARCASCNRSIFVPAELFREAHVADAGRPAAPASQTPAPPVEQAAPPAATPSAPSPATAEPTAPSGSGLPGGSTGSGLAAASKRPVAPPDKSARPIKIQPRVEEPPPVHKKKSPLPMLLLLVGLLVVLGGGIYALVLVFTKSDPAGPGGTVVPAKLGRPIVRIKTAAGVSYGFFISDSGYLVTNLDMTPSDAALATEGSEGITVEYAAKAGEGWIGKTATVRNVACRAKRYNLAVLKVDLPAGTEIVEPPIASSPNQPADAQWAIVKIGKDAAIHEKPGRLNQQVSYPVEFSVGSAVISTTIDFDETLDGAPAINGEGNVFGIALFLPNRHQTLMYLCAITPPLVNELLDQARGEGGG